MGTQGFLERLLEIIARREGAFGDLLAEGLARAAVGNQLSDAAKALMPHGVAPIGEFELEPPRIILMHSLLYPMEPRVHQPLIHDVAFIYAAWTFNQWSPGSTKVTNQVVRDVAEAFWGSEEAGVFNTYDGKALQAKIIQNRVIMEDSLGLCNFTWPIVYSFATPDMVGDPTLEERLFEAVTGHPAEELREASERVANLQRAILIREGRQPEADLPPAYNFSEPVGGSGYHRTAVPGPGDEPVDMTGNVLDRGKYDSMLREYYRLRGWDDKGVPEPATLAALGLETLAPAGGATSE
jgi:aldehyde:ferredoxin oxidoreductase